MAKVNLDTVTRGNLGISARAIVIKEGELHYTYAHELGEMNNHTAKWAACIYALEHARGLNISNTLLCTGPKLAVDSANTGYMRDAEFEPYFDQLEIFE